MIVMSKKEKPNVRAIIVIIAISIILLLSALQLSGIITFFAVGDYDTGLSLDTTADFYEQTKHYEPLDGDSWLRGAGTEALKGDVEIVAWQEGQSSSKIVSRADFEYHARATCEGAGCFYGYKVGVALGRYWMTVDLIDSSGQETRIINTKTDTFDTTKVELIQGPSASDYAGPGLGHYLPNTQLLGYLDGAEISSDLAGTEWMAPWAEDDGAARWYPMSTSDLTFKLKDNVVGGLRYNVVIEYLERENTGWGSWEWHSGTALVCSDEIYLAGGLGEVIIESTHSIGDEGTETTPETDIVYTKFLFEEESEVVFKVNAGYSGASLDPDDDGYGQGWSFEIYNSGGIQIYQQSILDGVYNYPITYPIPVGAFIPNDPGNNVWSVVLMNTAFAQSETRLWVVDDYEKVPGKTTITTDKQRYVQYETVQVTLRADANEQTGLPIESFEAFAKYGSYSSVDYVLYPKEFTASHISGQTYGVSFSFQLTKGNKNVYIQAHAIDTETRGGAEGEWNVFSEQAVGNYQVTVTVVDEHNNPLANAQVEMGTTLTNTNPQGIANIYINFGTHSLTVTKTGYTGFYQGGITVQSDMDIPVQLVSAGGGEVDGTSGNLLYYVIIGVLILFAALGIWYYLKKRPTKKGKKKKK